jgi:hypothetical protein
LEREHDEIEFKLKTKGLVPGDAYTLWLVVVNNPTACSTVPCAAPDIIGNAATDSQVRFADGRVAGGSGKATFRGEAKRGPLSGWLPGRALKDPFGAEIHLVVNSHGPKLPAFMPGMIRTYRGGCSDSSPFPPPFPQSALDDGVPGPNTCLLFQSAVFLAP